MIYLSQKEVSMMTKSERIASRKRTLYKYNRSEKRKAVNRRYRKTHKKQCSLWTMKWMKENRERVKKTVRARYNTPEGKAIRQASSRRYAEKNRIKRLAKDTVHNAIRAGKLNKMPCAICGIKKAEGHHPDYTKPLKVIWLCKEHHTEIHKK
jgi:hypothetical protein